MGVLDVDRAVERIEEFLADRLAASGADGYVVGVSGGLDSAVAATLAVDAVGAEAVTAMVLPGTPSDPSNLDDARELGSDLGVDLVDVDISPVVEAISGRVPFDSGTLAVGNLRARTRMVLLYLEANARDHLVIGTTNRSEWLLGYFTKYGDGAADLRPLVGVYKSEMRAVARSIGVDEAFVRKAPSAELWAGQTDAGELGADYETIDAVLTSCVDAGRSAAETARRTGVPVGEVRRFLRLVRSSGHKRSLPPQPEMPR